MENKEKKYNLIDCTQEEQASFLKDFQAFLEEKSMYFEPIPQFIRRDSKSPWEIVCQIFLQKRVEEEVKSEEGAVESNDPEVNPVA